MRFLALVFVVLAIQVSEPRTAFAKYSDSEIISAQTPTDAQVRELRNQEVNQLRIALGRRTPANRRADLYLRLAEIYVEAYRTEFLLEGRVHEKRLADGKQDRFIDRSHSKPYLAKAIQACNDILKLKIPHEKIDQVYYFLGFNYGELEDRKNSLKYFIHLTQKFPNSPFATEAYRELGDAAFEGIRYRDAQKYYEAALRTRAQGKESSATPRIMHRLAWTYYRTKNFDRAIETMKKAVEIASENGEKLLSLKEEALRDMAVFYTETGRVSEAIEYFDTVAGDKGVYAKILEKLGKQYERNVEPHKAIQVYESVLKTHPDEEAAFRVRVKLVDLDLRRAQYASALKRIQGVKLYTSGDGETLTAATNLRAMVRRTATEHHEKYRKTGAKPALEVAEDFYFGYLALFLKENDPRNETPEVQMYLAEIKRELGKVKEASGLYRKVLESKDKRYSKEAAALWLGSLADVIKRESQAGAKQAGKAEPSQGERDFVSAADEIQDILEETPEAREAALRSAQILAGYKSTREDAIDRAEKIVSRWPKTQQGLTAARLWVQIYADTNAADDLRDVMEDLQKMPLLMAADREIGGSKLKSLMEDQDARLKVGAIASKEKDKDYEAAAKGYEAFGNDSKRKDIAEKAYASAVTTYLRIDEHESVERILNQWFKRFPPQKGSGLLKDSVKSTATAYLISGNYIQSASFFEKLGLSGTDEDSLETAARLFEGSGDSVRAQKNRTRFLELYKVSPNRWDILISLARSQKAANLDSEAAKNYRLCIAGSPKLQAECGVRLADLLLRARDVEQAKTQYKQVASLKGPAAASPYVGYARYRLSEFLEEGGRFDALELPEAQLKKALGQRLEFFEALTKSYMSVVDAGGPWGVAALNRLAKWAVGFAEEVDRIRPPQSAEGPAIAQFQRSLSQISAPLRKKAVATWSDAYSKAVQLEILSPAMPEIADRLADAKVNSPGRAQGPRGKLRLSGVAADGGSEGRSVALQKVRDRLLKNAKDDGAWVEYGNLLWGEGKPMLAKLSYERALALNPKNAAALNNRGVVALSGTGQEDWVSAAEALALFKDALKADSFFYAAKFNQASLLNYYRIFSKARPLWEQAVAKSAETDTMDGQAVSIQGMGDSVAADPVFRKASEAGGSSSRFAAAYHVAARVSMSGTQGAEKCLDQIEDIESDGLAGFEKQAVENLKRTCVLWKSEK